MALTGSLKVAISLTETKATDLATGSAPISESVGYAITDGTGANQANVVWSDERTLTATSEDLDLNGVLTDIYGPTINLLRVKGIYIKNESTTSGANLSIGSATSNAWAAMLGSATDKLKVGASGVFLNYSPLAAGFPVTAGTADILKVDAGANTITYKIIIFGANA